MRISSFSVVALGFGLAGIYVSACSNSADDCTALATCGNAAGTSASGSAGKAGGSGSGGDGAGAGAGTPSGGTPSGGGSMNLGGATGAGGAGAGGEGGAGPKPCTGDVADDPACWTTNEHGVFVSNESGDDNQGDGSREAPFASIGKGIGAAAGKNVYVCLGTSGNAYDEQVILSAATDGVRIYGGFDCSDWSYSKTRSAAVAPKTGVIALRIQSLKKGAYIENLRFTAADGNGNDASSYGAFVTDSKNVVLTRVGLTAGKGLDGADQADLPKAPNGAAALAAQNGKDALCGGTPPSADGGTWPAPTCGSQGGDGGKAVRDSNGGNGFSGTPSQNVTPPNKVNLGTGATDALHGADGTEGSPGDAGSLGVAATALGSFLQGGFTPAGGQDGGGGFPGQGGGGGGASKGSATCRGGSGGAGGMGGCGGPAGKGGGGGGASIGLFSWGSDVTLLACTIESGTGGAGGNGGKGGPGGVGADGGSGGAADVGNGIAKGGRGGSGGNGGNGGSGSGGTGGPSYALVYSGTKPTYDPADTMLTTGDGGLAGVGGQVLTAKAPDGSPGDSAPEFEVK